MRSRRDQTSEAALQGRGGTVEACRTAWSYADVEHSILDDYIEYKTSRLNSTGEIYQSAVVACAFAPLSIARLG